MVDELIYKLNEIDECFQIGDIRLTVDILLQNLVQSLEDDRVEQIK